ncbi:branched-chain amino acid transaminase [[Eubacterium] cellulosolvens]
MSIEKQRYVWMNGEFVEWDSANVPILTHGLNYGTGVFEGIRAYKTDGGLSVFRLKEHIHRLKNSAHAYRIDLPYTESDLCQATTDLLAKNEIRDSAYIRPIVFKGAAGIGLDFRQVPTWVAIVAFPYNKYFEKEGLDVCVSSWRKTAEPSVPSMAKASGHYINAALARVEAGENGFDETIFLDHRGFVSEGSGENIFIVRDEALYTPPLSAGILEGVTRDSVRIIAGDTHLKFQERDIARSELYSCDEAFFTGTAVEICPILSIDRRKIGDGLPGPLTRRIRELYSEIVSGKNKRYDHWLTSVYPKASPKPATEGATVAPRHATDLTLADWQLKFWEWARPQGP